MKLLIITQTVDTQDLYLGFFCRWIEEFASKYEYIHVICLKEGHHSFPSNVSVYSLGKEKGSKNIQYIAKLFSLVWKLRRKYDSVFIHMNQEYILLCGLLWKVLSKKIYLWRNHYAGNILTRLAVLLSTKVFCTSRFSYTARFKKTTLMPVGVDTTIFHPTLGTTRKEKSILFYARLTPSKHPDIFLKALGILKAKGMHFSASLYGTPLPRDREYALSVQKLTHGLGLDGIVTFSDGVPYHEGPSVFSSHEIFVNLGDSGMYDKMIFEAAACQCIVLASSKDFAKEVGGEQFIFGERNPNSLAVRLEYFLTADDSSKKEAKVLLSHCVERNTLSNLVSRIASIIHE